ncbi:MAG: hypothetical protein RBS57_19285 [Desulforhabdus sp.]|nr:hypothetical protein [Desulforhabdus sp.]
MPNLCGAKCIGGAATRPAVTGRFIGVAVEQAIKVAHPFHFARHHSQSVETLISLDIYPHGEYEKG